MEPYIVILLGIYLLYIAICNPDWAFEINTFRNIVKNLARLIGRNNARIIIGLIGIFLLYGSIAHLMSNP